MANARCPGILLAHGEVTGQGPIAGIRYGHAWAEIGDAVVDPSNGRIVCARKDAYYALGKITGGVVRYSPEEARRMMLETLHYGPWPEYQHPTGHAKWLPTPVKRAHF
ncbi:MAG: hypothetical protein WCS65_15535 [Verrucomicrobiae bacterium]